MEDPTTTRNISDSFTTAHQDTCQWPTFTQYKPLDRERRQIRLLTIEPGQGIPRCSLEQVDLIRAKPYHALSYVWGHGVNCKFVIINNEKVLIRSSLWGFLKRLRDLKDLLPVWVDALCINQLDVAERVHQVTMMADIFKRASVVISWLGRGEEDLYRAPNTWLPDHNISRRRGMLRGTDRRKELYDLFARPYWLRLWIMQEVAVARMIYFMDEHNKITLDDLLEWLCKVTGVMKDDLLLHPRRVRPDVHRQVLTLVANRLENPVSRQNPQQEKVRAGLQAFETLIQLRLSPRSSRPLPMLVRGFRHAECHDPRDHIYGLLAIARAEDSARIIVDYSSPVLEVYLRNIDVWADEKIRCCASGPFDSVYDGHAVINSLTQFLPASGPCSDIFDLWQLRANADTRSKVVSKLCFRCERIPGKPSYHTFACYSISSQRLMPVKNDHKLNKPEPHVYISLVHSVSDLQGTRSDRILYSTIVLESSDIFLKLRNSDNKAGSSAVLLIARRTDRDLYIVGSGKLFEASAQMIKPDVWLSFRMPDVHYEINKLPSLKENSHPNVSVFGSNDQAYHITFNGMAIAQMLEDNDYMAEFGKWDMFEFITQHQLMDVEQTLKRPHLAPETYQLDAGTGMEDSEVCVEEYKDGFNRLAPQLDLKMMEKDCVPRLFL